MLQASVRYALAGLLFTMAPGCLLDWERESDATPELPQLSCDSTADCVLECPAEGCEVDCSTSNCSVICSEGPCIVNCSTGTCTVEVNGPDAQINCGTGGCTVTGAGSGKVSCGVGDCTVECNESLQMCVSCGVGACNAEACSMASDC
jgi:hypothetical protein